MDKVIEAKLKYLHITPRKARFLVDVIRGLPVNEAEAKLMLSPRRASIAILKLLRSAVANADHDFKIEAAKLFIKEIRADQGTKTKRWMPRARGGAALMERKNSHITLILGVSDKLKAPQFSIKVKSKKERTKEKEKKAHKEKDSAGKQPKVSPEKKIKSERDFSKRPGGPGFFKKFFQRKSI